MAPNPYLVGTGVAPRPPSGENWYGSLTPTWWEVVWFLDPYLVGVPDSTLFTVGLCLTAEQSEYLNVQQTLFKYTDIKCTPVLQNYYTHLILCCTSTTGLSADVRQQK